MEINRLADQFQNFRACFANGNAARKIGHVCTPTVLPTLDYHHVSHRSILSHPLRPASIFPYFAKT